MKLTNIYLLTVVGLALAMGVTGCHRKPKTLTDIPGRKAPVLKTAEPAPAMPGPKEGDLATKPDAGSGSRTPTPGTTIEPPTTVTTTTTTPMPPPTDASIPAAGLEDFDANYYKDREFFKSNAVFFDFDRSTVKAGERVKVEEVALYLKGDAKVKLLVEGHCDERGTEEYNRALGERRALSLREYLVHLGIGPDRIHTISYGEDQPAVPGHNEAAWAKNRRGEFILLKPKK